MQDLCSLFKTTAIFLIVLLAAALHAQNGLSDAVALVRATPDFCSTLFGPSLVTADFNNDRQPDVAFLLRAKNTFRIEVHLGRQRISRLAFASSLSNLEIAALDINHDGSPDLVVEDPFSRQLLFVWLNDGSGSFHAVEVDHLPAQLEKQDPGFVPASHRRDYLPAACPGKLKIRQSSTSSFPILDSANLVLIPSPLASHGSNAPSSPNLLRGPPAL